MWKLDESDNNLDQAQLSRLACQLQEVLGGEKEVVFSGGEPLLYKGLSDVISEYSQKGFKVGLASNGVLVDDKMAKQLVEAGLKTIQLSFDSCYEKTHDFLRGVDGVYKKVLEAASCLSRYKDKLSLCAQTVISGKNINEIVDTVEFVARDPHFDFISFMAVTTPFFASLGDDWRFNDEFSFLWPKEKAELDLVIDKIIDMKKNGYPIANPIAHLELFRSYFHNYKERNNGIQCSLGDYVISVDPQGDVRLCCFMPPIANIAKDSLREIFDSQVVDELRQKMKSCQSLCNTLVNCFWE